MNDLETWVSIGALVLGAAGGFLYWKRVGCLGGTCSTFMSKYPSMLYGALVGLLLSGILLENFG